MMARILSSEEANNMGAEAFAQKRQDAQFERTQLLYGTVGIEALRGARVAVFGLGGVGGHVAEALVRTGIGAIDLIDADVVELSNLNRQLVATHATLGQPKAAALAARLLSINPECAIRTYQCFYGKKTASQFNFAEYAYVVDAVDTVTAKLQLVMQARAAGTPIISAMGAGFRFDPTQVRIADIYETSACPLARIMRKELRKRGVENLKVAYSLEPPMKLRSVAVQGAVVQDMQAVPHDGQTAAVNARTPDELSRQMCGAVPVPPQKLDAHDALLSQSSELLEESMAPAKTTPERRSGVVGSNAFVPAAMGLALAAEVVRSLTA